MKQWPLSPLVLAGAVTLAACSDTLPTEPGDSDFGHAPPSELRGLDAEFTRLAQEIPGFGGMFYDGDGRLNVFVAGDQSNRAAVTRALTNRVAGGLQVLAKVSGGVDRMVVRDGEYDFAQLSRWHGQMRQVLGLDGVVFTDIDETRNRLRVGVDADAMVAPIQVALERFEVPTEAVDIEVTEPVVPLTGSTLQQRVQPFGGGLQLVFPNPMPGFVSLCTLGFNILHPAPGRRQSYFVTNSHCTLQHSVVDNTPYYQQPVAALNPKLLIAIEVQDPPFLTDPLLCPYAVIGFVCRYSDAAIARYVTPRTAVRFASIYRTEFFGTGAAAGSVDIGGDNPKFFDITDEEPFPLGGEVLDKMGRTTGWTRGPVTNTCVDVAVSGTNIAMLCQDFVQAAVGGGDSGSPVFQQVEHSKNARLYGILWGGAGSSYVFSAMENIHFELGDFRTH